MEKTNAYFMNKWPDSSHIWTRAVYYEGLMDFYKVSPKKTYVSEN